MEYLKKQIEGIEKRISEAQKLLADPDMEQLARAEITKLERQKKDWEKSLLVSEPFLQTNAVIMEIRSAAGGNEAGLFAALLYRMYVRYAQTQGWQMEQLDQNTGGIGNIKEVVFRLAGPTVYEKLKHESGVHRVQRIPDTESSGRIHTSTVTVAVLPEVSERQFHLDPKDLKVETYKASGHGGQNVQKVETAVRITHLPSGTTATCQSERSQFQNKERALSILRSRVYEAQRESQKKGIDVTRKLQVGTGERSEKIRTYNFPQDRITDHRVNKSWHNLEPIMNGELDKIFEALKDPKLYQ
ncbi:MAG: peptide chain release factor 1 [Candidatus Woykebacteria bacterium RBG_19FT_COMBO_43_10]|uniref:Peptide chain release factor 1 n=1 Tax=Candidatus Woykebacteria bacterium RBG_19FT_COMBO_43_10 TaxID=1802598 RepID=A0A1G1WJH9_9BACT|nr:MAG: peptide chain release factor 1 [Candidatus Woykebacteria bacterium RBG_19FT_COMBO_43_10]